MDSWALPLMAFVGGTVLSTLVEEFVGTPLKGLVLRSIRARKRLQRLQLPEDAKVFEEAWTLYKRLPPDERSAYEEIEDWLLEDSNTDSTEEMFLVLRKRGRIQGVLYASVYKDPVRCLVENIAFTKDLSDEDAKQVANNLWEHMVELIDNTTTDGHPDLFIERLTRPESPQSTRVESVLADVGAQRVALDYRAPSNENLDPSEERPSRLLYIGRRTGTIPTKDVLNFVYGEVYFWRFRYGEEFRTIEELHARTVYFNDLIERVQANATHVALEPFRTSSGGEE